MLQDCYTKIIISTLLINSSWSKKSNGFVLAGLTNHKQLIRYNFLNPDLKSGQTRLIVLYHFPNVSEP